MSITIYGPATQHSKTGTVYIFVIANIQSFTSQIFGVVSFLEENLDILVSWDLTFKKVIFTKPKKFKLYSVRALKRHLNEKNSIHGRVMAAVLKFSPHIFETYFSIAMKLHRKTIRYIYSLQKYWMPRKVPLFDLI